MRFVHYFVLASTAIIAACGDDFGPINWSDVPDTLQIYSASRPDLIGLPSAFDGVDFGFQPIVPIENGEAWDFMLAEQNGEFVMVPVSATSNTDTTAALATIGEVTLDEVTEAPPSSEFVTTPVPIEPGNVYVLRTRRAACSQFTSLRGPRYGKLEAIAVNSQDGTFEFAAVVNPQCNDRKLVPPDDD